MMIVLSIYHCEVNYIIFLQIIYDGEAEIAFQNYLTDKVKL